MNVTSPVLTVLSGTVLLADIPPRCLIAWTSRPYLLKSSLLILETAVKSPQSPLRSRAEAFSHITWYSEADKVCPCCQLRWLQPSTASVFLNDFPLVCHREVPLNLIQFLNAALRLNMKYQLTFNISSGSIQTNVVYVLFWNVEEPLAKIQPEVCCRDP